jgi:hypothetical protein
MENERIKRILATEPWISYRQIEFYYTPLEILTYLISKYVGGCLDLIESVKGINDHRAGFGGEEYECTYHEGYMIATPAYFSPLNKGIYSSTGLVDKDAMDPKLVLTRENLLAVCNKWHNLMMMESRPEQVDFILVDNEVSLAYSMDKNPDIRRAGEPRETVLFKRSRASNVYQVVGIHNTIIRTLACFLVNDYSLNIDKYLQWVETVKEYEAVLVGSYSLIHVHDRIIVSHVPYLLDQGIYTPNTKQLDRHANCPKFIAPRERFIKLLKDWQAIIAAKPEEILLTYECDYIDENDPSNDAFEYNITFITKS